MPTQNWKTVYLGWSLDDFNEARYVLTRAGIGHCSGRRTCANPGAPDNPNLPFEHGDYNKHYSLYVNKKDYQEAQSLIDNALNSLART